MPIPVRHAGATRNAAVLRRRFRGLQALRLSSAALILIWEHAGSAMPEPEAYMSIIAGLLFAGWVARRRAVKHLL